MVTTLSFANANAPRAFPTEQKLSAPYYTSTWALPGVESPLVASVHRNELLEPLEPLDFNDGVPFVAAYVLSETFY